jgi:hypothetical protein
METHHIIHKAKGGKDEYKNFALLHGHCHDQLHSIEAKEKKENGFYEKHARSKSNGKGLILRIPVIGKAELDATRREIKENLKNFKPLK